MLFPVIIHQSIPRAFKWCIKMLRVTYKLEPFIFYVMLTIVGGIFIRENQLSTGVVA
jgi:hypothetical protein